MSAQWYVLHVYSGFEKSVAESIRKACARKPNLADQIEEVLVPMEEVIEMKKGAKVNSNRNHKGILPRLWSPEHAENYINFTGPLNFRLSAEYKNSDELKSVLSEFYQQQLDGELTGEDYHNFYKNMARYIVIEKPSFLSHMAMPFPPRVITTFFKSNFSIKISPIFSTVQDS